MQRLLLFVLVLQISQSSRSLAAETTLAQAMGFRTQSSGTLPVHRLLGQSEMTAKEEDLQSVLEQRFQEPITSRAWHFKVGDYTDYDAVSQLLQIGNQKEHKKSSPEKQISPEKVPDAQDQDQKNKDKDKDKDKQQQRGQQKEQKKEQRKEEKQKGDDEKKDSHQDPDQSHQDQKKTHPEDTHKPKTKDQDYSTYTLLFFIAMAGCVIIYIFGKRFVNRCLGRKRNIHLQHVEFAEEPAPKDSRPKPQPVEPIEMYSQDLNTVGSESCSSKVDN